MAEAKKRDDKTTYWILEPACLGRGCFTPGTHQVRGATMSGSRNTGDSINRCMTNAYHGCPKDETDDKQKAELLKRRRAEGWSAKR